MSCDLASPERINDMVTFNKRQLEKDLELLFNGFTLGDSIQVLDTYIYVEIEIGYQTYKVRFPYSEGDYYESQLELENAILLYVLSQIDLMSL